MEITVRSETGKELGRATHPEEAMLCLDHVWEAGDTVCIRGKWDAPLSAVRFRRARFTARRA